MDDAIIQCLKSVAVCSRCLLRYSNSSKPMQYQLGNTHHSPNSGCICCLDLLSDKYLEDVVELTIDDIKSKDYEVDEFSFSLVLPQCLVLREKSLTLYIQKSIGIIVDNSDTVQVLPKKLVWTTVKEALKFSVLTKLEQSLHKKHDFKRSLLDITLTCHHIENDKFMMPIKALLHERNGKCNKGKVKQPLVSNDQLNTVIQKIDDSELTGYISSPPPSFTKPCSFFIKTLSHSTYVAGRYNKYSRRLSQTPWVVNGKRLTESSVQELICEMIMEKVACTDIKFMSCGREDVDVKMLGRGRPFAVELINPKRILKYREAIELQERINKSTELVAVRDLQVVSKDSLEFLKFKEDEKQKFYRGRLWCPEPLPSQIIAEVSNMKNVIISQNTPLRVLHRRPLINRKRTVICMSIKPVDENHYDLFLETEAGTYIKEFVHSDFGRTTPSLREMLHPEIDIVELDVEDVALDWPPKIAD